MKKLNISVLNIAWMSMKKFIDRVNELNTIFNSNDLVESVYWDQNMFKWLLIKMRKLSIALPVTIGYICARSIYQIYYMLQCICQVRMWPQTRGEQRLITPDNETMSREAGPALMYMTCTHTFKLTVACASFQAEIIPIERWHSYHHTTVSILILSGFLSLSLSLLGV